MPSSDKDVSQQINKDLLEHEASRKSSPLRLKKNTLPDPLVQRTYGEKSLDSTLVDIDGGGGYYRPDASGAVGPNNYVQLVNLCVFSVYDKSGNLQLATDLTNIAGTCGGDPVVLYDKFADRWVIENEAYSYMEMTIAISTTNDPLGSYYTYSYSFAFEEDYPKISIWSDGYYITFRNYANDTAVAGVFERNRMLIGDTTAGLILTPFPNS